MNKIVSDIARNGLRFILVVAGFLPQLALSGTPFEEWCEDRESILRQALYVGALVESDAEEVAILVSAAEQAQARSKHRFEKYFRYTLQVALSDFSVIYPTDISRQAGFLRFMVREAISDVRYLREYRYYNNTVPYVLEIMSRVRDQGMKTPQNREEISLLTTGIQRAIKWLEVSDYIRTPSYACAYEVLGQTLKNAALLGSKEKTKIQVLRDGIDRAAWKLRYSCM
jgi:hypothetical protein